MYIYTQGNIYICIPSAHKHYNNDNNVFKKQIQKRFIFYSETLISNSKGFLHSRKYFLEKSTHSSENTRHSSENSVTPRKYFFGKNTHLGNILSENQTYSSEIFFQEKCPFLGKSTRSSNKINHSSERVTTLGKNFPKSTVNSKFQLSIYTIKIHD